MSCHEEYSAIFTEPDVKNCLSIIALALLDSIVNIRFVFKPLSFNCFDERSERVRCRVEH